VTAIETATANATADAAMDAAMNEGRADTVRDRMTPVSSPQPRPFALSTTGITRRIGDRNVVDDVSFDVSTGELLVLVGPSGCGKSTLLRIIAGLDTAADGRILLEGVDVTPLPPERRRIGLVFQDHALFPHRRVGQNIAFGLKHLDKSARARRVDELLELVRLPGVARRYPHELSGGEQQRIALARALAPDPAVVLLDEPFASLDPSLRDDVRTDVVAALRERHAAAVLVTHERDEALGLGDRIAVMEGGRLLQVGEPDELYERPVDRFVAEFLGTASFLPTDDSTSGELLMARPHDLRVTRGGDDVVTARRYLGSAWRVEVRRADGVIVDVDMPVGPDEPAPPVGAPVTVSIAATHPLHRLR
jgi:iron(III) transport system ATP-binding protein